MTEPRHADPRVARVVDLYETLAPTDLPGLRGLYAPDARFKDPFNQVQGVAAIAAVFDHMFRTLDGPRFRVLDIALDGDQLFLTWDFDFRTRGAGPRSMTIHGATRLRLDAQGRVVDHRDYWDAAEELYEKLPLIGMLMRWLKRRAGS
jgi:limonene-1,2-epoxide hydrolase